MNGEPRSLHSQTKIFRGCLVAVTGLLVVFSAARDDVLGWPSLYTEQRRRNETARIALTLIKKRPNPKQQ